MATLDIRKELPKWKRVVNNKLRGAYGITDYDKREIQINKKAHRSKRLGRITPNKNGTESIIHTIVHEEHHRKHPRMHEKTVRKLEKKLVKKLGKKGKRKLYAKYRIKK